MAVSKLRPYKHFALLCSALTGFLAFSSEKCQSLFIVIWFAGSKCCTVYLTKVTDRAPRLLVFHNIQFVGEILSFADICLQCRPYNPFTSEMRKKGFICTTFFGNCYPQCSRKAIFWLSNLFTLFLRYPYSFETTTFLN